MAERLGPNVIILIVKFSATALGLESGIVQNDQFTASSSQTVVGLGVLTTYHPYDARLNGPSRWCPDGLMDQHPWIKVSNYELHGSSRDNIFCFSKLRNSFSHMCVILYRFRKHRPDF